METAENHPHIEGLAAHFRAERRGVDNGNDIKYNGRYARGLLMEHNFALDPLFESSFSLTMSHLTSQSEVNDFIHGPNLLTYQSEVMSSRLESCTLLGKLTVTCLFLKQEKDTLLLFFPEECDLVPFSKWTVPWTTLARSVKMTHIYRFVGVDYENAVAP
jgi:hypothetical protein